MRKSEQKQVKTKKKRDLLKVMDIRVGDGRKGGRGKDTDNHRAE
jgi:hypothetical protein